MTNQYYMHSFLNSTIGDNKNFKWREALYLQSLDITVVPPEDIVLNIIQTANKMQNIRDILGMPIYVTSWYRPEKYNSLPMINGSPNSYHRFGLAVDFVVKGVAADAVRELLLEYLEPLNIRMEDLPKASWVHIDLGRVIHNRFFKP